MQELVQRSERMTQTASRYLNAIRISTILVWLFQTSFIVLGWVLRGAPDLDVLGVFLLSAAAFWVCRGVLLGWVIVRWTAQAHGPGIAYDADTWRRLDLVRDAGVALMVVGLVVPASYSLGFGMFLFGLAVATRNALQKAAQ